MYGRAHGESSVILYNYLPARAGDIIRGGVLPISYFYQVMHSYIRDTEFATKNLFALATDEERQLEALLESLRETERRLKVHQWDFQTSDLNDDFSDVYVMAAFARTAKAAQEFRQLKSEVATLQASIGTHQQAVQAIAGAILQIAKQGISLVHGGLGAAPAGRALGSLAARDIIWQARNQSMHYEEPQAKLKKPLLDLFRTLEQEQGA